MESTLFLTKFKCISFDILFIYNNKSVLYLECYDPNLGLDSSYDYLIYY